MAITRVQTTSGTNGGGGTTVAATWAAATTAHNMLIAVVASRLASDTSTISPPTGQFWIRVANVATTTLQIEIWVLPDAQSLSGAQTWNLSVSKKATIHFAEYSGAAGWQTYQDLTGVTASGTSTTAGAGSTTTSTNSGDVFISGWANVDDGVTASSPTNGFAIVNEQTSSTGAASTRHRSGFLERIPAATSQYHTQVTLSGSTDWVSAHVALLPLPTTDPVMNVAVFTYVGDGVASRHFVLGFQPDVVIYFPNYSFSNAHQHAISNFPSGYTHNNDGGRWTTMLASLDSDGFTIGSDPSTLNNASITYYGIAFGRKPTGDSPLALISYTGNGTDNTGVDSNTGFLPDYVWITREDTSATPSRSRVLDGGDATFPVTASVNANEIQKCVFDGVEVGSGTAVNNSGTSFRGFGLKRTRGNAVGDIRYGSYVGDGTDNRNITVETGFQPDFVITIHSGGSGYAVASSSTPADSTLGFFPTTYVSNWIQALNANGFQVGSNVGVNNSGTTYYYIAIKATVLDLNTVSKHLLPLTGVGV